MGKALTGGTTNVTTYFMMRLAADGTGATGLTPANFDLQYTRSGAAAAAKVDATLNGNGVGGAWSASTVIEVDAASSPGLYRIDWVDAAFAAGVPEVELAVSVATAFTEVMAVQIDPPVNVTKISGDSVAADNLESQYDTTGLTGGTFPATQDQVGNITNTGSAVNIAASSAVLTTGNQTGGTYASTAALDGVYNIHTDDGGTLDLYYQFLIGSGTPASVTVTGYLTGNNDELDVEGYDWNASAWVQIGTLIGTAIAADQVNAYDLMVGMVGTGADLGKVRIRFTDAGLTTATLGIDQIFVSFSQGASGYDNGAVWLDTNASNTNTVVGVDGIATNPVSTIAAVNTLLASTGLHKVEVAPASSFTLAASQDGESFDGDNWTLALGGQSISDSHFRGAAVTGIATGATPPEFHDCLFGAVTLPPCTIKRSGIGNGDGLFTGGSAGQYVLERCYSVVAGAGTPDFKFDGLGSATGINNRGWLGGSSWTLDSDCTVSHEVLEGGGQTFVTGGADVEIRGTCRAVTLTLSGAETVQFVGTVGPITLSGTTTATVNLYGVSASLADTTVTATVVDRTISGSDTNAIGADERMKSPVYDDSGEITSAEIHVYFTSAAYVADVADEIYDYTATVVNGQVTAWSKKKQ